MAEQQTKPNDNMYREYYYTATPVWNTTITEEDFNDFLANYPRPLVEDASRTITPTVISFNDYQLADKNPFSIVAECQEVYDDDGELIGHNNFKVMTNYAACFNSRTGNKRHNTYLDNDDYDDPYDE